MGLSLNTEYFSSWNFVETSLQCRGLLSWDAELFYDLTAWRQAYTLGALMHNIVTFEPAARKLILEALDITEDSQGFLIEKGNTSVKVLSRKGDELRAEDLGAIKKGSLLFFKSDLPSLIDLADSLE